MWSIYILGSGAGTIRMFHRPKTFYIANGTPAQDVMVGGWLLALDCYDFSASV